MKRILRITTAFLATVSLLAVTPGSSSAFSVAWCYKHGYIKSVANGRYVTAELGYTGGNYGMLRARASSVGAWQRFTICGVWVNGRYGQAFKSEANGKWVSAELGY